MGADLSSISFVPQFDAEGAFESAFLMLGAAMRMATAGVQQVRASSVVTTPVCACAPWVLLADILWPIFYPYFILWICVGCVHVIVVFERESV